MVRVKRQIIAARLRGMLVPRLPHGRGLQPSGEGIPAIFPFPTPCWERTIIFVELSSRSLTGSQPSNGEQNNHPQISPFVIKASNQTVMHKTLLHRLEPLRTGCLHFCNNYLPTASQAAARTVLRTCPLPPLKITGPGPIQPVQSSSGDKERCSGMAVTRSWTH